MTKGKKTTLFFFWKPGWVYYFMTVKTCQTAQQVILSFNPVTKSLQKFQMIKRHKCLSTKWNRMGSKFVAGLVRETIILYMFSLNITDRFLRKADFILSKKIPHDISIFFFILYRRFVQPQESENWLFSELYTCITPFQEHNPFNKKGPRNCQMLEKRNSIPMQNTHDLLVGTLST